MRYYTSWVTVGLLMLGLSALGDGTNALQRPQTENRQLRDENRKIREEMVQGGETKATTNASGVTSEPIADAKYWITTSSKKRHNPTCKYFKKSKGYPTNEKIGAPCQICGG